MIQLRIFMVTMKQIRVVGISSASQAPGTSHKFPSSWSSSARYQIRLRQTVLLQKRPTARRRATVMAWWRTEMLMHGWSSSERSSPHSAPTPPSSPPTCHHRHPLLAARPSSQQRQSPPHTTQCYPLCQSPSPSIIPGLLLACQADGIKTPRRGGTQPPLCPSAGSQSSPTHHARSRRPSHQ